MIPADCGRADCGFEELLNCSSIRNPKSAIQNEKSRAQQRGTSEKLEVCGVRFLWKLPELFSGLFCVAASRLNSPRFSTASLYAASVLAVKPEISRIASATLAARAKEG
jgi:hypothetical protein